MDNSLKALVVRENTLISTMWSDISLGIGGPRSRVEREVPF